VNDAAKVPGAGTDASAEFPVIAACT